MEIERCISLFDKQTDKLLKEVDISHVSQEALVKIFGHHQDDLLLHKVYTVNKKKLKQLNRLLDTPIQEDLFNIIYTMDSFQK